MHQHITVFSMVVHIFSSPTAILQHIFAYVIVWDGLDYDDGQFVVVLAK